MSKLDKNHNFLMNHAQNLSIHKELKKRKSTNCAEMHTFHDCNTGLACSVFIPVRYYWHAKVFTWVTKFFSSNLLLLHKANISALKLSRICWRESFIDFIYVAQGLLHLDSRILYSLLLCGTVLHYCPGINATGPLIFVLQAAFQ